MIVCVDYKLGKLWFLNTILITLWSVFRFKRVIYIYLTRFKDIGWHISVFVLLKDVIFFFGKCKKNYLALYLLSKNGKQRGIKLNIKPD